MPVYVMERETAPTGRNAFEGLDTWNEMVGMLKKGLSFNQFLRVLLTPEETEIVKKRGTMKVPEALFRTTARLVRRDPAMRRFPYRVALRQSNGNKAVCIWVEDRHK